MMITPPALSRTLPACGEGWEGFTQCVGYFWRIGIIFSEYKLNKQDEIYSLKFLPVYSAIIKSNAD
jgi:hypothetical protein